MIYAAGHIPASERTRPNADEYLKQAGDHPLHRFAARIISVLDAHDCGLKKAAGMLGRDVKAVQRLHDPTILKRYDTLAEYASLLGFDVIITVQKKTHGRPW